MLDYSGTLLHGLHDMGAHDVFEALGPITRDPRYRDAVEWLGAPWGHPVAPSTPVQDYRLHVRAWQHHFAALFGLEALGRVRGFSPSEMALPNHPDVAYEFVRTLTDSGYEWVLVQEHTVEQPDGRGPEQVHLPHLLCCTSSRGETASIVAVVKTQGSDTKLVAQMQPYYEAKGLGRGEIAGKSVPPLVIQIADGENGGVMMNEFPPKYVQVVQECSGTRIPMMNVTKYLEQLWDAGVRRDDLPVVQPLFQNRIWQRMAPGDGPERLGAVIEELAGEDARFHVEGGSWTNNISWCRGYDQLLMPMEKASTLFHEGVLSKGVPTPRPKVPERPIPPAHGRDKLLPLLGRGCLDRLRRRTRSADPRHHHPRLVGSADMVDISFALVLNLHQPHGNLEHLRVLATATVRPPTGPWHPARSPVTERTAWAYTEAVLPRICRCPGSTR